MCVCMKLVPFCSVLLSVYVINAHNFVWDSPKKSCSWSCWTHNCCFIQHSGWGEWVSFHLVFCGNLQWSAVLYCKDAAAAESLKRGSRQLMQLHKSRIIQTGWPCTHAGFTYCLNGCDGKEGVKYLHSCIASSLDLDSRLILNQGFNLECIL